MAARSVPADHPPFAALPVRFVTVGGAEERLAVHVAGRLADDRLPVVCLPGYTRNMSDFTEFAGLLRQRLGPNWPLVLVDLRGRGRSSDRGRADDYTSVADARDIAELARALAIDRAVVVGQGHGGQVAMTLAALRPTLIAGTVLVDAAPATAPRSLIRLRSNIKAITASRRMRRRSTTRPAASSPTRLQLFLPRSIPRTAIVIVPLPSSSRLPCKPSSAVR